MQIRQDNLLTGPKIKALLSEHLHAMTLHLPPESIHALDLDSLRQPEITFWTVWEGGELLGCGALKELSTKHAELKSMRTSSQHLRKGVARHLLHFILDEAKRRGYQRISLETGSAVAFHPAHHLYESLGFTYCPPFGDYTDDPYSVFMTRELSLSITDGLYRRV